MAVAECWHWGCCLLIISLYFLSKYVSIELPQPHSNPGPFCSDTIELFVYKAGFERVWFALKRPARVDAGSVMVNARNELGAAAPAAGLHHRAYSISNDGGSR